MEIQHFIERIVPLNILDLLERPVLENLLGGYSYALGAGIMVMYPTSTEVTQDTLDRIDALGPEALVTFHPICAEWRDPERCGQNAVCQLADRQEAIKYYDDTWSGPRIFCCQPLSLWDMTFPFEIESRVVGVLFGGQLLVDANPPRCKEALKKFGNYVDWGSCITAENHIERVRQKLKEHALDRQRECLLFNKLREESTVKSWVIPVEEFQKRIRRFLRFGEALQVLLLELYKARRTADEQSLLSYLDERLTGFDLADADEWWDNCGQLLVSLSNLPGMDRACIYGRQKSRYLRRFPQPTKSGKQLRLLARDVLPTIPTGELTRLRPEEHGQVLKNLRMEEDEVWAFHSRTAAGSEVCSTLILLSGHPPDPYRDLVGSVLSIICSKADVAQLVFRLREMDAQFRHKVALIGHSFRTPLQSLALVLEAFDQDPAIGNNLNLKSSIVTGTDLIFDLQQDLLDLLEPETVAREDFDFMEVLDYVIERMEPIARSRQVVIVKQGSWPRSVTIHGVPPQVQRALTCLLDNATKYSFRGQRRDGGGLFQVRLRMTNFHPRATREREEDWVKLEITNYGIGIPEDKLAAIREYGFRADIHDDRRTRLGTGLGLPIAIDVVEELGGWIYVSSRPAPKATPQERQKHHRFITTVEVVLPTKARGLDKV